jgi:hypothetical protein
MKMNRLIVVCVFLCLWSWAAHSALGQSDRSADESGTLVVLGQYGRDVFLAVDSQVHGTGNGNDLDTEINWKRKLVLVGKSGACATEGWEGSKGRNIVLSDDLWAWSAAHPTATVQQSMEPLLWLIGRDWDNAHYSLYHLPTHRRVGDEITNLYCVDFVRGKSQRFVGSTTVSKSGDAHIGPPSEIKNESVTIAGVFGNREFVNLIPNPNFLNAYSTPDPKGKEMDRIFVSTFKADFAGMVAFDQWETTLGSASAVLSPDAMENLTKALFRTAEQSYKGEIAPPNNLVVSGLAGRTKTTVETKWPRN